MKKLALLFVVFIVFTSCKNNKSEKDVKTVEKIESVSTETEKTVTRTDGYSETKNAYFGNLHVHTSWSYDAYTNGSVTNPDDAYRWALGESIAGGKDESIKFKIKVPLDWYAVSDHAEYMGVFKKMEDPNSPFSKLEIAKKITSDDPAVAFAAFAEVLDGMNKGITQKELTDPELSKSMWQEIINTADNYNQPGKFTTFPAFEWTSAPNNRNLHRVVLFKNSKGIPEMTYSTMDSDKPEDLWKYMDNARKNGATLLAVPHNGNASDGMMFSLTDSYGKPITKSYSDTRMLNEPLYEITQIKGTSETHPDLSQNDEFANFEQWDYTLSAITERPTHRQGSFLRQALKDGLKLESDGVGNPFKYGIIGDSDTHNSASSIEEDNNTGKFAFENTPEDRLEGPPGFPEASKQQVREFSSAGLAGIWAEENTREAIYNAMIRKETFGTSGTRMKVRFFGSFNYDDAITSNDDWLIVAYANGVPMGSNLTNSNGKSPTFIVQAIKEVDGANLDRAQIIKGWLDADGKTHEKIYNVALSDNRTDGATPVGNTVNLKTAKYSNTIGAVQFFTTWTDPEFDASQNAFYYTRVIEIPTPRWSTYDAATLGIPVRTDIPSTIQERGWSSPIWYSPK